MNFIRKACTVFSLVLASLPFVGFTQYQHNVNEPFLSNLSNAQRYEIGGGLVMSSGNFTGNVRVLGPNNYYKGDSTLTRPLSGMGFGGSIGVALPFKGTGHISCWAATIQLMANMTTWSDLNQTMSTDGSFSPAATSLNGSTMQVALPLGIDYKIGNDALVLTRRLLFNTALGAGVMPQINMTTLEGIDGFKAQFGYGFTPYAKVDLGFLAGICWKVRLMYTAGNVNLLDVNRRQFTLNDGPFDIRNKSQIMASLIIMPFSGRWSEVGWYNTYDTYNHHDRFN
jgi:hypothetical protein